MSTFETLYKTQMDDAIKKRQQYIDSTNASPELKNKYKKQISRMTELFNIIKDIDNQIEIINKELDKSLKSNKIKLTATQIQKLKAGAKRQTDYLNSKKKIYMAEFQNLLNEKVDQVNTVQKFTDMADSSFGIPNYVLILLIIIVLILIAFVFRKYTKKLKKRN